MFVRILLFMIVAGMTACSQTPSIEPGVSLDLARWRAARYSDIRYKLDLTLEKMSPVLKGTMEIRLKLSEPPASAGGSKLAFNSTPIILDWRKISGSESLSVVSNVFVNGKTANAGGSDPSYDESNEHLIFRDGVVAGENVITLDFTSPILTSGSAITRYVDKEDGAEYIYSLFVPSDASTAFPVFDQPDLKARFTLTLRKSLDAEAPLPDQPAWKLISNTTGREWIEYTNGPDGRMMYQTTEFAETQPISTYVFAFAAGPFERVSEPPAVSGGLTQPTRDLNKQDAGNPTNPSTQPQPPATAGGSDVYVRKSQAEKFKPHAAEVFRLKREGVRYLETYFDYKFPFPKYDLVLIPEFPFGGMEHAGATFLREASVIFPTEPTANDKVTRANLIFHETAHQWFGDTVTMKWFDDLWLKEGFAEFMAYKTLEKVMPEYNAWKIFYERNKQAAYLTDSTKGTTPIYQEIANLSNAKSAYGNIVYRKAPSFLRQAEFYVGEEKFQTAVRAFLKKHEFANAGWEDLVAEFESAGGQDLKQWANVWVKQRGLPTFRVSWSDDMGARYGFSIRQTSDEPGNSFWKQKIEILVKADEGSTNFDISFDEPESGTKNASHQSLPITGGFKTHQIIFPNYNDRGYGIFLLDSESRDYVMQNIQNEDDPFLRTMMWGSLWDSVREAELAPKDYVELVVRVLSPGVKSSNFSLSGAEEPQTKRQAKACTLNCSETDEGTIQTLLSRVSTAMNYYVSDDQRAELVPKVENLLIDKMQNASTPGQQITYYRSFLNIATTERARNVLKQIFENSSDMKSNDPGGNAGVPQKPAKSLPTGRRSGSDARMTLQTKDKFDIVSRLLILNDLDAPGLLAQLEKTETSDDARRYAYAAAAGIPKAENKAKYWNDLINNKEISESWLEAALGPLNSIRQPGLTIQYLDKALAELPNLKRSRKIFFVNSWLLAFIGGQRDEIALQIVNKFLTDNPKLDNDLRLKVLENVDLLERALKIRARYAAPAETN